MASTFAGLSISTRGLFTSAAALAVTNNNISNANTVGYSRQVVNQQAVGPAAVYNGNYVGSGSEVTSVTNIHNFRLDQKYWRETGQLGELQTKSDMLSQVEAVIGDTDDDSLSAVMEDFYASMEDFASDPTSSATRAAMKEAGVAVCEYLNTVSAQLSQLKEDSNSEVQTAVDQINAYATQIAELNTKIRIATAAGSSTNELEDQRTLLIDQLSSLADVEVTQTVVGKLPNGADDVQISVSISGETLVSNDQAKQLECYENEEGMYSIRWQDTGTDFEPEGGQLKAYFDLRDGDGTGSQYKGITYYSNLLDQFASTFAEAFNTVHSSGYGLDGSTGVDFFAASDSAASITAANISLSAEVLADTDKIAASSSADGGTDNNENMNALIELCEESKLFGNSTAGDFINSIVSTLGTASEHAQTMTSKQSSFVTNIDTRRQSVSGVSINEETANLTKYEAAYNASAQMISVWQEIYQTTINMVNTD
ncbi:flagellar hook-associated protein FlgK [Sporomusa sp.]|uniref:flagellar hook-associated protein FlgK n=1 Tax=Sporomusa sp. TaxID=2078658 RepID=UPI002C2D1FBE|nr:flagellar hook-associated protein FlgK [Sporomusa sp.]HWR07945.1 flagellar hook-associated protein FlgK [Sporomusa sp.]